MEILLIELNGINYYEKKSLINIDNKNYDIIEILSLNQLFRYSKLIIIDRTKTKNICIILQNPANDDNKKSSIFYKIIKELLSYDNNINSIVLINLFATIASKINNCVHLLNFEDESHNMIYIQNNIFNTSYDEYYLGYGQHCNRVCKKLFRIKYCNFLSILLSLDNIIIKKFHDNYCYIDNFKCPPYPFTQKAGLISITLIDKSILKEYYDKYK